MPTSRTIYRGDIPSYYTSATGDNDDSHDDGYLARLSHHSSASAVLPLPPTRVPSEHRSTHSTASLTSGIGSLIDDEAIPSTARRGRRASPPTQIRLSRSPTSLSMLSDQIPTALATTTDDHPVEPSPAHSSEPLQPQSDPGSRLDFSSTRICITRSQRGSQRRGTLSEEANHIDHDPNRLSIVSARSARTQLAAALAALPWAEPPPRAVSPSGSSVRGLPQPPPLFNPGFSVPTSVSGSYSSVRSPAYAFLQDDPVTSPAKMGQHFRPSSRASSSSRGGEGGPSVPRSGGGASRTSSLRSVHTPMPESMWISLNQPGERPFSGYSGMADVMSEATHEHSEESLMRSLSAAIRRLSRAPTARSSTTNKSTRSGRSLGQRRSSKSTKSKRGSSSIISHRYAGTRWSVDPEGQARLLGGGGGGGWEAVEVKQREADLDLLALVGRAAMLERMLRAGKRVRRRSLSGPHD